MRSGLEIPSPRTALSPRIDQRAVITSGGAVEVRVDGGELLHDFQWHLQDYTESHRQNRTGV